MTIVTEPHQIFYAIIPPIFVNVMDEEHAEIIRATPITNCRNAAALHDVAICVFAMSPARMIFSNDYVFVLPHCKAGFITEERLAF
ncbi:MAG TPA: hypothetical protein VMA75_04955 [Candidatus Paceibacterota bacterium]|nr:hypothetical protein [Candidatus Paceibacterota bacterium]